MKSPYCTWWVGLPPEGSVSLPTMEGRVLVTGGLGFIGSAFIRRLVGRGQDVFNVDLGTYASDVRRLAGVGPGRVRTEAVDVRSDQIVDLVGRERPDVIVHFAAETHVTRSERDAETFFRSNIEGTRRLMEAGTRAAVGLIVHISTDEVYGPSSAEPFGEQDKPPGEGNATSAYARSKALADDIARSYSDRVPVNVIRPTNCFGPWQHPEKAIPRWVTRAIAGQPIPVWGDGRYVRDWMFVEDACAGIDTVIERGEPGGVYNLGPGDARHTNLEVAGMIARAAGLPPDAVYLTEYDRPQHDRRYAINASKVRALGWRPAGDLEQGIAQTVEWYRDNRDWWISIIPEAESLYSDGVARPA